MTLETMAVVLRTQRNRENGDKTEWKEVTRKG